jgi:predicted ester cyclase
LAVGQTRDRNAFRQRRISSRSPFPDLRFELGDFVAEGNRVNTQLDDARHEHRFDGRPRTVRLVDRCLGPDDLLLRRRQNHGHRQVVDRLSVVQQLGLLGWKT